MNELWKWIPNYEGEYEASNKGRIRSYKHNKSNPKILKIFLRRNRYYSIKLSRDGKTHFTGVHRLVAKAFIPNTYNKPHVNHIDKNPSNNCVENLEWVTVKENCLHKITTFPYPIPVNGEKTNTSKLKIKDVMEILNDKITSNKDLAKKYHVNHTTIYRIKVGQAWRQSIAKLDKILADEEGGK